MTDWAAFNLFVVFVAGAFLAAWALGRIGKSKREGAEE